MKYLLAMSGGKDSTALAHLILDKGLPLDEMVYYDCGWDFPEVYEHLELVKKKTGLPLKVLYPSHPYDYFLYKLPVYASKDRPLEGVKKGDFYRKGNGWPSSGMRWCVWEKTTIMTKYQKTLGDYRVYIGIGWDERKRIRNTTDFHILHPLIDAKMGYRECYGLCRKLGYHWGGLYDIFSRVSCYLCPLQPRHSLKSVWLYRPKLWKEMRRKQRRLRDHPYNKIQGKTVFEWEKEFKRETYGGLNIDMKGTRNDHSLHKRGL